MGNCKSYSTHFNVYKNNTNELYENLICNFIKEDKLFFCRKAFVVYEILKKKLENSDLYVYYIISSVQRKKVKNAVAYLNEDYDIEVLNFFLKLFKRINNEYYNNIFNFHLSSYYNYLFREDTKFTNYSEQMNLLRNMYDFIRLKFLMENICLHVYFQMYDNCNEYYEWNDNFLIEKLNNNEITYGKLNESLQLNKKIMSISIEKNKIMHLIKKSFKKIENFCRNILHCNMFDNFKMSNEFCLYILLNNYKIKCILYNIFNILIFINNYYNIDTKDGIYKDSEIEIEKEKGNVNSKKLFNDKLNYSLEHTNIYKTYLFICLCLSFDNKNEEDVLFNTHININQNEISFTKCVSEYLDICISEKKLNKFFSQEIKEKKKYCFLNSIQNSYMNDSLINTHYICQNQYIKSILNIGNSNYFIKNNMMVFCFILFENSLYEFPCISNKSNITDHYSKSFTGINKYSFLKKTRSNDKTLTLRRKFWKKVFQNNNFVQNVNDENKSDIKGYTSNSDFKKIDHVEFDLNNIGFFRIDLYNLRFESDENFHEDVEKHIKLYTIKKKNNSYIYVKKKVENETDLKLIETMKDNYTHVINVLKTMRNKEICYISAVSDSNESLKIKKENDIQVNGNIVGIKHNDYSCKSKCSDKIFKKETKNMNSKNKHFNYMNSGSKIYITEENNTKISNENNVTKSNCYENISQEYEKKSNNSKIRNKLKKPFFIGIHDTFVPFEIENLIFKLKDFYNTNEKVTKKKNTIYKEEIHNNMRTSLEQKENNSVYENKREKEKKITNKNKKNEVQLEKEITYENKNIKENSSVEYENIFNKEDNKYKIINNKESIFKNENRDIVEQCVVNKLKNKYKEINEENKENLNFNGTFNFENDSDTLDFNEVHENPIMLKLWKKFKDEENLQEILKNYNIKDKNEKIQEFLNKIEVYSEMKNEKIMTTYKNYQNSDIFLVDNMETIQNEKNVNINEKEKEEEENYLEIDQIDVEKYEEKYEKKSIDFLKIFIQHKNIGEMNYFVNKKNINISFNMFKIHEGKKKLILSTYTNSKKISLKNYHEEKIDYNITLNKDECFKYIIDLLFLHLNYNRLYFIYIPKKLIDTSNMKFPNDLFLSHMCCNCDIILENLYITPGDLLGNYMVNNYVSVYFEKTNFITLVLFLLFDIIKIYNKIKKLQCYFESICKKFMKNFHDYFNTRHKKVNYDLCKIKKRKILSIPNELLKKKNVKKSEHNLSNDINISSSKHYSNFSEEYISAKKDNNVDKKSLIINVSSTLNSENYTNNINNNNNINSNINNNENNIFNNYYLNKANNENPFNNGYKYKNIYIKIIDLKLYEFINDYINYIKENNSCYSLCPYIFVYKFESLCFLFIPVCNNFYLIFYLFFFHFLNCSDFFNFRRCFNGSNNHEYISKMNSILPSNNNFLHINNVIKILNIHKNNKTYIKYISLNKRIENKNIPQYYKWIKNKIIIDIRNSFSSPYFIRTNNFCNFVENTNLHINLKKLYLNKDHIFTFKLDKRIKQNEKISNVNDIIYMFNHSFNIFTYLYDEKKSTRSKELFYHSKYIIIPYFEDIYINKNNLHIYLKIQETRRNFFKSDKTCVNQNQNHNQKRDYEQFKKESNNGNMSKEEQVKIHKYSFIYNIYENCNDTFINYFYFLINKLILEAVSEIKSNNFLNISHLLNLLDKYEVNFDIYFWVLYDNYMNIYKKYCIHAELVKFFNNNNRNKTYNFDYLKKIKYNCCNKKKFYMKRILIFSVCLLVSFICKRIFEFFVTDLNYSYEYVLSSICFFFFSKNAKEKINNDLYLNILKSIYFNLFFSLSFVLQYIPLRVQHLNLFKIIKKVKKYKIILSICLNYVCGINLPFYIFYEIQNMPYTLMNDFFLFEKKIWNMNVKKSELMDSINTNEFGENYYDEFNFKIKSEKEKINWINENLDFSVSNDSLHFFKSKKVNKKIYKYFHENFKKNKNLNLINLIIKMNFISCLNIFKFHDFQHASNNILSYFKYGSFQNFKQNCRHDDLYIIIFSNFVSFMSLFRSISNYEINEYQNTRNFSYSNHDSNDLKKISSSEKLDVTKKKLEYCEINEYLKEPTMTLENNYSLMKVSSDLLPYGEYNLKEKMIFDILLKIIETKYSYLLIILPIFAKENFNLLTDDLKIYLINIFFFIFIRTDKYKICKKKKKNKIKNLSKINKYYFNKEENNDIFHSRKKNSALNNSDSENFFFSSFDFSKDNYFETEKKKQLDNENETKDKYESIYEIETDVSEYEMESETDTEMETETDTNVETENRSKNENINYTYFINEESSFNHFKDQMKIILLDNYHNIYLIEFFLKIVLRIIPFYNIKNKNKHINVLKSSIIYNSKIIISFLISFKNIILSMKNNFYVFIYYFFVNGYISLILLDVHRAFKYFKKMFLLIIFFFGNPIFSLNYHPFLIYVTYILYVLTILSKLNLINFYKNLKEKKMIDESYEKINIYDNNNERIKDQLHYNKKIDSNNVWMKQKYEIWMYLEIIRKIKRNYTKFNNNIYLVPLNYSFINMKKIFRKYIEEKVENFGNINVYEIKKNFVKKKINNIKKKKNNDNFFLLKEMNINDKLIDKNLPININNNFVALYPTVKNVKVPRIYLVEDIFKSLSSSDFEKKKNFSNHKTFTKIKNNSNKIKEFKCQNKEKKNNEGLKQEKEEKKEKERERKKKKNVFINPNIFPINNFPYEKSECIKDENNNKSVHGIVHKKDISNVLLYNLIYINKMNRKLNNCKFVFFNFKYYNYKKIISNENIYYKMILENFKKKLCENYYAYTFGNNEDGSLAIGKPSYLKLTPTIGSIGYEKNKKSVKKGTDFWFTNNLQLIPIKIKKICMNESMISIIDKKHNLYIAGNNTFTEIKNELLFKNKNGKAKYKEKQKNIENNPINISNKIKIDKFFINLRLKKMKKYGKYFFDYNSSSCDSDNLIFGNSLESKGTTNFLKSHFHNEKLYELYKKSENKIKCNSCLCASLNSISDNFSSCKSDILSSFDSEDSDNTYIKVKDKEEINKNMNVNILLKSEDKCFYVKKKNYSLKKISIDDFNIYNSILYSSSYANQYLTQILPNQRPSIKSLKKYFKQKSTENVDKKKKNYEHNKYSQKKQLQEQELQQEEQEQRKNDKESYKKNGIAKGKNEKILLDNNQNNNKFIYNFIRDIKTRIKFTDIFNGSDFVISINNFGHVYSWGNNKYGCLGTGDNINRYSPTLINPGHFFLYDFEKLQIHTNYKTEIKIKGIENINSRCCENILYNSLILDTIKKNIHNKNINSQNNLKEPSIKYNEVDRKFSNSNNFIGVNKCKDEDFFTLKTDNIYTSEHMFNFENLGIKNITISVQKIYVPISSICCGNNHVCAYSNGSIFMWGEQKLGQTSIPFENIYFDFNRTHFSDSDSTYKKNNNEKTEDEINKNSELLSSSTSSDNYYFHVMHKKKIENGKNKFNKNKILCCKKKFNFNVKNPIQNYFNITNNDILLNNKKLKLYSNLNSVNTKRKKINNDLVLVPVQVCLFNLSYRIKKNKSNINNKYVTIDYVEPKAKSNEDLINTKYNFSSFESSDDYNNKTINKNAQKNMEIRNMNFKNKSKYIRVYDYLETFIKAEVVNIYMSLFRNDINIYTNIPNNININPYIYGMKFYDYNFYDENYLNVQDYYDEVLYKKETNNKNKNLHISNENYYVVHDDINKKLNNERIDKNEENCLKPQKNIDLLNIDDPNKFVKLMKENKIINPQIYEYIEKEETVCINIKLIIFLFLFIKKKYMTIFLNSIMMVSNVSCGEANTIITCFKKSIYDKYYQYIMKNITCSENYKHLKSEKLQSKLNLTVPEYDLNSVSEKSEFIYRNDIYDTKNYTSTIVNWGDKSFDEYNIINSSLSCSDTSRFSRMIEEILANYMCIYVSGRDTNNNLCINNINQSVYTFTRITNNFFYYNFNYFLFLYKYNYYLYYIHKNNVHINHNNDTTYIQSNPLTSFKNKFNTFVTKENNINVTNSKIQGVSPNKFIIIKKIVCSNTVTCLVDTHNNVYMAGDVKYYFPNFFHHIAYASSPFIKINLNNTKTIKNISFNPNNIFLIYDDHSFEILGYNDYIDFFKYIHPIFFTNKYVQKHSYNMLKIPNSDFLVKQVQTGSNCVIFVMKKKKRKKKIRKSST
ncbi:conserved Plasmodium protein, unknown function [Plasmodium gallinaceum]|uniref:Uncharacterized protein n=1 Tax=Plasmodium gallinaceum TaxID=5849 RepID=A0A1J1GX81_PLAGA|nr:conserved Plasmodium protein, unknown function [Plasmodium gallinaceum]CRG96856.1 conserved Plasmodium protein, unknown function [Plasmodium gallinaceum]